jgi:hypothetical protein
MMKKEEILKFFDERFENIEMPCFGNMNLDYITSRLSVYRNNDDSWIVLFNSIVWWPAAEGLMGTIEVIGPGVIGCQGFDNDRITYPGKIESSYDDEILSVLVRGKEIDLKSLRIEPQFDLQPEIGFWAGTAIIKHYRDELLANDSELESFIPQGFKVDLVLDEWEHPDWDNPPRKTQTFSNIAAKLAQGASMNFEECPNPNTHFSKWLPK